MKPCEKEGGEKVKITSEYAAGRLVMHLSGELDHHSARDAMRGIESALDEYLPRDTALDLSGVTFMDSSGIALMLKVERRMRETGGRCTVENPSRQPMRVIDASGIDRLIPVKAHRA
jgi:stage II sporulation protein AA (anti-sigma F factor antagonist)